MTKRPVPAAHRIVIVIVIVCLVCGLGLAQFVLVSSRPEEIPTEIICAMRFDAVI